MWLVTDWQMCRGMRYGQKADVWALGCVLYEMASLRPAFTAYNMDSLTAKIKRGHHDKHLPMRYGHGLRKLIAEMLMVEPSQRPTADQVLQSQYLTFAVLENRKLTAELQKEEERAKQKQQAQVPQPAPPAETQHEHAPNIMVLDDVRRRKSAWDGGVFLSVWGCP